MVNISKISNGSSTYDIKDAEARNSIAALANVATTGDYNDLTNTPIAGDWINIDENKEISVKGSTNIDLLDITQNYYCLLATVNTNTACFYIPDNIDDLEEGNSIETILYVYYDYPLDKLTKYSSTVSITKLEDVDKTYRVEPTTHSRLYLPTISYDCLGFNYNSADSVQFTKVTRLNADRLDHDFFIDSSNNVLPTQKAVKTYVDSKDDSFVHKAGSEIITGGKTFQGQLIINNDLEYANNAVSKGQNPATTKQWRIINFDKNGFSVSNRLSCWNTSLNSNGDVTTGLFAYKNQNLSSTNTSINITYPINGDPYTSAPIPTEDTDTSTQIDTVGARNTKLVNYVTTNIAQTITGEKTFTKEITEKVNMTRGTAPAASMYPKPYKINDSADNMVGNIQFTYGQNMSAGLGMLVYNCNDTTDSTPAALQVYNVNGTKYATCPTPTEDTTGSIQIDTVGARNTKLGNYVTLDTAQTITGAKTFSQNIILTSNAQTYRHIYSNNSAVTKGTAPSTANTGYDYTFRDSTGSNICAIGGWYNTNGNIYTALYAYTPTAGSTTHADLKVGNYASGRADVVFETPSGVANSCLDDATNSTTSNMVALKGWVNNPATATNVVHRSGNETIDGTKTFSDTMYISNDDAVTGMLIKKTDITKGTAPSELKECGFYVYDKVGVAIGNRIGNIRVTYETDKTTSASIRAYKPVNGNSTVATIGVFYPASGDPYTQCPASDVNNSIVTMVSKSKSAGGYCELGNGLILQWGGLNLTANTESEVSFPKAFSLSNNRVMFCSRGSATATEPATNGIVLRGNPTTTGFKLYSKSAQTCLWLCVGF